MYDTLHTRVVCLARMDCSLHHPSFPQLLPAGGLLSWSLLPRGASANVMTYSLFPNSLQSIFKEPFSTSFFETWCVDKHSTWPLDLHTVGMCWERKSTWAKAAHKVSQIPATPAPPSLHPWHGSSLLYVGAGRTGPSPRGSSASKLRAHFSLATKLKWRQKDDSPFPSGLWPFVGQSSRASSQGTIFPSR